MFMPNIPTFVKSLEALKYQACRILHIPVCRLQSPNCLVLIGSKSYQLLNMLTGKRPGWRC